MAKPRQPAAGRRSKQEQSAPHVFAVDSFSAIEEFLRYKPKAIVSLRVHRKHETQLAVRWQQVCDASGIEIEWSLQEDVNVLAKVSIIPREFDDDLLAQMRDSQRPTVLAVDHVTDPRNLGAMIRSAAFFGVGYVLLPRDRQAPVTTATVATSMGGLAHVEVVEVTNLTRALRTLKDADYRLIGADGGGVDMRQQRLAASHCALVMGAEDRGLSRLVRECCDEIWSITGAPPHVESLNVAVATGILLQQLCSLRSSD